MLSSSRWRTSWQIPDTVPSDAEGIGVAQAQVLSMWIKVESDEQLVTYGLGRGGGATLHPSLSR